MQLKERSMQHINAHMASESAADSSAPGAEDPDVMEQPAEAEVEDDEIQKMATELASQSAAKRKRSRKGT